MQPIDVIVGLAGDPALELLNSRAMPSPNSEVELIGDGANYLRWLARTGLIDQADCAILENRFSAAEFDAAAKDARTLRETLRPMLLAWVGENSAPFPADIIDELNALLAQDQRYARLDHDNDALVVRERRRWERPAQLLTPSAHAWADLLVDGDPTLIRQCPGCTVIFYDHTKAHRRRWCSMAICGNRAKVRRHRTSAGADSNRRG